MAVMARSRWRNIILVVLAAAIGTVGVVVSNRTTPAPPAPFTTIKGERLSIEGLRGRVVLVSFWATDCSVCVKEMPQMVEIHRRFGGQAFESVFIAMKHDRPDLVVGYADRNALPFKVALDLRGDLALAFGDVRVTPTTFVVDKRGAIVTRILGEPDFGRLQALIAEKLKEPA